MTETDSCKQLTEILDSQSQSRNKTEITKSETQRDTNIMVNPRHDSRAQSDGIMLAVMRDEDEEEDGG